MPNVDQPCEKLVAFAAENIREQEQQFTGQNLEANLALVEVLSGLAIYKPVQLWWLEVLFGGYDSARAIHLIGLGLLGLFTLVHLVLVALHPRAIIEMITGGKRG